MSSVDDTVAAKTNLRAPRITPYHRIPYEEWAARKKGRFFNFNTPPRRDDPRPVSANSPPEGMSLQQWRHPRRNLSNGLTYSPYAAWLMSSLPTAPGLTLVRRTRARRYNLRPRGIITNKNPLKKHRYVLRSKLN